MFQKSTNTAAQSGNFLPGVNKWDLSSLEIFATSKKYILGGLRSKTILSSNGGSEIGASGASGYEIKKAIFNKKEFK